MSGIVPGSFRLKKAESKNLHPMTIHNDFVTMFAFHNAECEKIVPKGKGVQTIKAEERFPIIMVWDGKELAYQQAEGGNPLTINNVKYRIDRDVDDVFPDLPSEEDVDDICSFEYKKKIEKFDAKDLFDDVLKFFQHFFHLESAKLYYLISLFTINQCVFDAYYSTPYLYIRSPLEECGKTRLAKCIVHMWNGIISTNMDAVQVYRMIHGCSPTFVFDESKGWDARSVSEPRIQALVSVLNSGYQKGSKVYRFKDASGGKGFGHMKPEGFDSYAPKIIITTQAGIPRDLQSRCLELMMQRAPSEPDYEARWNETVKGSIKLVRDVWADKIRKNMVLFRFKYGMEIKALAEHEGWRSELDHTDAFKSIRGRNSEILKPLAILCLKYKPEWTDLLSKYANDFIAMRGQVTYSPKITVLWALRKAYQLTDYSGGEYPMQDMVPIRFEETPTEGQVMWIGAKHIRLIIEQHELGSVEELGKNPESKIGFILTDFGFVGTPKRVTGGNIRKIKTSRLTERCLNYIGMKLSDDVELSQQEQMELMTKTLRERGEVELESLYDILNGKMTEEQIKHCVKVMRTNGVVAATAQGGKGKITWFGV
jgi:hypothetical protein